MKTFTIALEPVPGATPRWRVQAEFDETGVVRRYAEHDVDNAFVHVDGPS